LCTLMAQWTMALAMSSMSFIYLNREGAKEAKGIFVGTFVTLLKNVHQSQLGSVVGDVVNL